MLFPPLEHILVYGRRGKGDGRIVRYKCPVFDRPFVGCNDVINITCQHRALEIKRGAPG